MVISYNTFHLLKSLHVDHQHTTVHCILCMCVFPIMFLSLLFVYSGKPTFREQPRSLQGTDPFLQMFHSPRQGLVHNYTATLIIHRDVSECEENTSPPVWLGVVLTWKHLGVHRLLATWVERLSSRSSFHCRHPKVFVVRRFVLTEATNQTLVSHLFSQTSF